MLKEKKNIDLNVSKQNKKCLNCITLLHIIVSKC